MHINNGLSKKYYTDGVTETIFLGIITFTLRQQ